MDQFINYIIATKKKVNITVELIQKIYDILSMKDENFNSSNLQGYKDFVIKNIDNIEYNREYLTKLYFEYSNNITNKNNIVYNVKQIKDSKYEHEGTGLIFEKDSDNEYTCVGYRDSKDNIQELTSDHKKLCRINGWKY